MLNAGSNSNRIMNRWKALAHTYFFLEQITNKRNARGFGLLKCECFDELSGGGQHHLLMFVSLKFLIKSDSKKLPG
jgi:hypothetical protein